MTWTVWIAMTAVAVGGAAIATQAPINARLASHVGDPVAAAAISFGVGFVVLAAIAAARGWWPDGAMLLAVPGWAWIGGALGAIYVWAAIWSVGTLGVVTLVAALIFGQMAAALVIDWWGAFGLAAREVTGLRVLSVALVAAGVVLSRL